VKIGDAYRPVDDREMGGEGLKNEGPTKRPLPFLKIIRRV